MFSSAGAATSWERGRSELASAQVYRLPTVRPNGHPHFTPAALWLSSSPDDRDVAPFVATQPDLWLY
ncbi:MAG: hypothetical protein M3O28_04865 [Actinomycetota bacterium]|nr:hypothetical protein [Actinomycetota bacterium]